MKRFTKKNEEFTCDVCGVLVPKHPNSSRDHCNICLCSLHVDVFPGDRANSCRGILQPIGLELKGDTVRIRYQCRTCHAYHFNIVAPDDNQELIVEFSSIPFTT